MIQKAKENLNIILTVILIIGGVVASLNFFALASDLQATNKRLDYKIVGDQVLFVEKQIFIIETRHNINVPGQVPIPMSPENLETYHKLKKDLLRLYKEQDAALKGS
jgi:hypothetical protein